MKTICIVRGSRADYGLLQSVAEPLVQFFDVCWLDVQRAYFDEAFLEAASGFEDERPDCVLVLGDRFEVLAASVAAHLQRIRVAHIAGGDVTEGSYDDAMRDCISRLAWIHFPMSEQAAGRLLAMGCTNVHMVGNLALDEILRGEWRSARPIVGPYVVVNYQAETIDGTNEIEAVLESLPRDKRRVIFMPNEDAGSAAIRSSIGRYVDANVGASWVEALPRRQYLNLIAHADELIGNSSSMLYEAPALGVTCRMIGKRQRGRAAPTGDGHAGERIANILRERL